MFRNYWLILRITLTVAAAVASEQKLRADSPASRGDVATTTLVPVSRSVESGPLRVTAELDRDSAVVPEPITLTLTVEAERGVTVTMPEIGELLGDFLVQHIEAPSPTEDDLHRKESRIVTLEPALPGDIEIPSLIVGYEDRRERADGSRGDVVDQVATPTLTVRVALQLADVKDPASLNVPRSYTLAAWLLGVIVAVALIALVARRLRRGEPRELPKAEPTVPAHIWALAQLDMLAAEGLLDRGRVQEWYYRINAIVRQYIERRYGLMAGEQTSEEFLRDLQRTAMLSADHKRLLQRFISACDPVKYARQLPDAEETRWVDGSVRDFVHQTAAPGVAAGPSDYRTSSAVARPIAEEAGV